MRVPKHVVVAVAVVLLMFHAPWLRADEDGGETTEFLKPADAIRLMLPDCDDPPGSRTHALTDADRAALEERLGRKLGETSFTVYTGMREGQVYGYAVIASEVGKFKPFDFIVAVSPGGKVLDLAILVYRESRGSEIGRKRFNRQLVGKTLEDPFKINQDVINITGATMSVRAICAGVKKVLAVVDRFVLRPTSDATRKSIAAPDRTCFTPDTRARTTTRTRPAMGTLLAITVADVPMAAAERAIDRAFERVEALEHALSSWRADSELRQVLPPAHRAPTVISADLYHALSMASQVAERTDGAFDPTVAPLVRAWGFLGGQPGIPAPTALAEARARVDWRRIQLDAESSTLRLTGTETDVDLGGIGKGIAVDHAVATLRAAGVQSGCVNFGGNLRGFGTHEWPVEVQHPRSDADALSTFTIRDRALSTSGDYEKFFLADGVRYGHILDPRTGWPVQGVASVTVLAEDAGTADALSTALVALGPESGRELLRRWYPGVAALFAVMAPNGALLPPLTIGAWPNDTGRTR